MSKKQKLLEEIKSKVSEKFIQHINKLDKYTMKELEELNKYLDMVGGK